MDPAMISHDGPMLLVQMARDPDTEHKTCCGFLSSTAAGWPDTRMAITGDDGPVFHRFCGRCHASPARIVDCRAFDSHSPQPESRTRRIVHHHS